MAVTAKAVPWKGSSAPARMDAHGRPAEPAVTDDAAAKSAHAPVETANGARSAPEATGSPASPAEAAPREGVGWYQNRRCGESAERCDDLLHASPPIILAG